MKQPSRPYVSGARIANPEKKVRLTAKQARFVEGYITCHNATQAAINAGYSRKTARSIASETLAKPAVQAAIADHLRQRNEQLQEARDFAILSLAKVVNFDIAELFNRDGTVRPMDEWPPQATDVVASFKYGPLPGGKGMRAYFKFHDRFKIMKLLCEITGAIIMKKNTKRKRT